MDKNAHETRLALQARFGDRQALEELLGILQQPLYRYIRHLVLDDHLAEDILQEVFVLIYQNLRWLHQPRYVRAWAYRIASREAFRTLKRERRLGVYMEDEEEGADIPAPEGLDPDLAIQLPQMLDQISTASRTVLVLHYMSGLPLAEVAAVLGIPLGTVKSRLAYGLKILRHGLKEHPEE